MCEEVWYYLHYSFQYFEFIKETIAVPCSASLRTANNVERCPRNELEWNAHAARLNCSSINQTCVDPSLFEYHCVLNKEGNKVLEVCAPSSHIFGNQKVALLSEVTAICVLCDCVSCRILIHCL